MLLQVAFDRGQRVRLLTRLEPRLKRRLKPRLEAQQQQGEQEQGPSHRYQCDPEQKRTQRKHLPAPLCLLSA